MRHRILQYASEGALTLGCALRRRGLETFDQFEALGAEPDADTYNALLQVRAKVKKTKGLPTDAGDCLQMCC